MDKNAYVYMLASGRYGTLYVGVTSNLIRRVWEHREGVVEGFTKTYAIKHLVWFETHTSIIEAIRREKQIKHWERAWKLRLVHEVNPQWRDLYDELAVP